MKSEVGNGKVRQEKEQLRAENQILWKANEELQHQIELLTQRLNLNSSNRSKSPSSDQKQRAVANLRSKTGKKVQDKLDMKVVR